MKEPLRGKDIVMIQTIGSWYASGYLKVYYRRKNEPQREARIHVNTLLPILQKYDFEMHPNRTFEHLKNPKEHKETK